MSKKREEEGKIKQDEDDRDGRLDIAMRVNRNEESRQGQSQSQNQSQGPSQSQEPTFSQNTGFENAQNTSNNRKVTRLPRFDLEKDDKLGGSNSGVSLKSKFVHFSPSSTAAGNVNESKIERASSSKFAFLKNSLSRVNPAVPLPSTPATPHQSGTQINPVRKADEKRKDIITRILNQIPSRRSNNSSSQSSDFTYQTSEEERVSQNQNEIDEIGVEVVSQSNEQIQIGRKNNKKSRGSLDSMEDLCRICHCTDEKNSLIQPCLCKGSIGRVHKNCLERWLEESGKTNCEICGFEYVTERKPKYTGCNSICAWLRHPINQADTRNLFFDLACFFVLTPLAGVSAWLCVMGAQQYTIGSYDKRKLHTEQISNKEYESQFLRPNNFRNMPGTMEPSNATWTSAGLLILTATLLAAYYIWLIVAVRYHIGIWKAWRARNFIVRIIPVTPPNNNQPKRQLASECNDPIIPNLLPGNILMEDSSSSEYSDLFHPPQVNNTIVSNVIATNNLQDYQSSDSSLVINITTSATFPGSGQRSVAINIEDNNPSTSSNIERHFETLNESAIEIANKKPSERDLYKNV